MKTMLSILFILVSISVWAAEVNVVANQPLPALTSDQEVNMITVEYGLGESSPSHRHNAHTFIYVLEGSVIMQVKGEEPVTLSPGNSYYERPEDIHILSKNASDSAPAKFLVFFIKPPGTPSTVVE